MDLEYLWEVELTGLRGGGDLEGAGRIEDDSRFDLN